MRTMYDTVPPSSKIPTSAQMVAGYVDGLYRWSAADWSRFPNAIKVRIAVFASTNDGVVLDVESGDATPAQAVGWVQRRRAAGVDPTVYCGYGSTGYSWALVINAFRNAGVPEPHYWVAAYPGNGANLYPGSVAHQYANAATSGGNFDLSVVADVWPGVDPIAGGFGSGLSTGTYTPLPPTAQEPDMDANQAAQLAATNDNVNAIRQYLGILEGNLSGKLDQVIAALGQVTTALAPLVGIAENAAETRREAGVLLGAIPPAAGESRPASTATLDPATLHITTTLTTGA